MVKGGKGKEKEVKSQRGKGRQKGRKDEHRTANRGREEVGKEN